MPIGEKIKYFRTQRGITQGALAALADIHPVSIRKYETNKMYPQPPQIKKIAAALNVSYSALNGASNSGLRLETLGDFMGVLMVLYDVGLIQVKRKRAPDGSPEKDTVALQFHPAFTNLLELQKGKDTFSLENILIHIKDTTLLNDFLHWEKANYSCTMSAIGAQEKEAIALELQSSSKPLI